MEAGKSLFRIPRLTTTASAAEVTTGNETAEGSPFGSTGEEGEPFPFGGEMILRQTCWRILLVLLPNWTAPPCVTLAASTPYVTTRYQAPAW